MKRIVPLKRTPLKRKNAPARTSPIARAGRTNPKRKAPRRGRIVDKAFLAWATTQPCCISGELPATTHHVRSFGSCKDDRRSIRLAARFHLHDAGMFSIERLGKAAFESHHGIDIEAEIAKLNARHNMET